MVRIWKEDLKDFRGLGMKLRYKDVQEYTNFFLCKENNIYEIEENYIKEEKIFFELLRKIEEEDYMTYIILLSNYYQLKKIPSNNDIEKILNSYFCFGKRTEILKKLQK